MHLHPQYPASSGGQGRDYSSLTPPRESREEACTQWQMLVVDICPSGLPTISQFRVAMPQLAFGKPPHYPHLVYEIKGNYLQFQIW